MSLKTLPRELTTYDLFKIFAVVVMIIDHAGFYFFFDDLWWRVAGRACVPIWFFLIGYAQSRDVGPRMWMALLVLVAGNMLSGMSLLPLNIVATMLMIRLLLDPLMAFGSRSTQHFWIMSVAVLALVIPTNYLTEYGTLGVTMAIFGYLARHSNDTPEGRKLLNHYMMFAIVAFVGLQNASFVFSQAQFVVLSAETLAVMMALYFFRPAALPRLTAVMPGWLGALIKFGGRRTLEIYVAHLLLFKALGMILEPHRFAFLAWEVFSPTGS